MCFKKYFEYNSTLCWAYIVISSMAVHKGCQPRDCVRGIFKSLLFAVGEVGEGGDVKNGLK